MKKIEFSKAWLIGCTIVTFFFCIISYIWALIGVDTVADLSVALVQAIITVDGASFASYAIQNCVRAYSADKYGYPEEQEDDPDDAVCGDE